MKKFNLLIPSLFVLLYIAYPYKIKEDNQAANKMDKKLDDKLLPSDRLYMQRSYPYSILDLEVVDKVRQEVKEQMNQTSSLKNIDDTPWSQEGPTNLGGRINCIAVHPENEDIILTGTAAGGIYKTEDGGDSWNTISDAMGELSTSSIVFDPNNPDIIYVGTGDHNISGNVNVGDGLYKSTDAGETWVNMGLTDQRIISRIVINPDNSQEIYAAAMGMPFERNDDRGLYKSTDGGESWEQILFVSDEAGIIDLIMNPSNSNQLYASSWNRIRNNSESIVSGTDAHIYRTNDGGLNWELVDNGLPMESGNAVSRIGLAMSQENPGKVFCVITDAISLDVNGVYKLDADANSWDDLNANDLGGSQGGFGWYFGQIRVNPENDDELTVLGVDLWTSSDGGSSWDQTAPPWWTYEVHADKHDMVYLNDGKVLLATDGGLYKADNFENWEDIDEIPNSQFYRITVNPFEPTYTGGLQDNGTTTGNSSNLSNWSRDRGGDGFQPIYSPDDPDIFYTLTQNGGIGRSTGDGNWDNFTSGIDDQDRRNWDMPIIMSVHNSDVLYTGTYRVYKNTDAYNDNWQVISPVLTGEVIESNSFHTITTIAESVVNEDILYSGSVDSKVYRTLDGGDIWDEIGLDLPQRYVTNIKTSNTEEGTVYISHSGYKDNDNLSHIHVSYDFGNNWVDISGDLPNLPINHIEVIDDEKLVIATDMGVYYTSNTGNNWFRVGNNMPSIPVLDIEIDEENGKLIAGTFARSMMSFPLDSLTITFTGLDELTLDNLIEIFPNPTVNIVKIKSEHFVQNIRLLDSQGRLTFSQDLIKSKEFEVDLTNYSAGVYHLIFQLESNEILSKKLLKE